MERRLPRFPWTSDLSGPTTRSGSMLPDPFRELLFMSWQILELHPGRSQVIERMGIATCNRSNPKLVS